MNGIFTIGGKKYSEVVPHIGEARLSSAGFTVFPYRKRRFFSGGDAFIKSPDGTVYSSAHHVALLREFGTSDVVRRAWCKAAGVKFADLQAVIKADRAARKKRDRSREVERLRAWASRLGYKVSQK